MRRLYYFSLVLVIAFVDLSAVAPAKEIKPLRVERPIIVDGKLDEAAWQAAETAGDFVQFEPNRGEPAAFKTEVNILIDHAFIYIGARCFDPEPGKITAKLSKRDSGLTEDDSIGISLDTFLDGRTAYYFFTNPLGAQIDGRLADNGRTSDDTWDAEWQAAARVHDWGWSAEIAVPLSALKYPPGENVTWGLGMVRTIPRRLAQDTWTGPVEDIGRVSQFGRLTGMNLQAARKRLQVVPHVIGRFQQSEKSSFSAGVDARYAITQDISSDLTVNPDFATVEADQEQINLTRFELQLPEKRNFFLEGSEIYSQRIRLFYSRRIADIYGGLKLYGKKGGFEFSGMTVQSKPDEALDEDAANFSVLRVKQDIFESSTIGLLTANKLMNGRNYGSVGLDLVHFFSEKVNLTGQFALSYGDHATENLAFFIRPSYDSATFHIHLRYTQLGENFADNANSVGFIRDDDRHELDSAIAKTWWIKRSKIFERFNYFSNYNIYWSKQGELRSYQIDQEFEIDFKNKLSFEVEYTNEYKLFEKDFYNHRWEFELGYNTRAWQSAMLFYQFGKNFDLDFQLYGVRFNYKLFKTLTLEYELDRVVFEPDPDGESTWVHVLRLTNYFNRDFFFKMFYQTNTAIDKYSVQALLVYRYKPPFGTIQLAYQKGTARLGEAGEQGHTLFVKLTYVF